LTLEEHRIATAIEKLNFRTFFRSSFRTFYQGYFYLC